MRRAIMVALATIGLLAGSSVQAQAGTLCNLSYTLFCGEVYNGGVAGVSQSYITVTTTWPTITKRYVAVGSNTRAMGIRDTDGFYAPAGWCVTNQYGYRYPTGWNKITDLDTMYLKSRDC